MSRFEKYIEMMISSKFDLDGGFQTWDFDPRVILCIEPDFEVKRKRPLQNSIA